MYSRYAAGSDTVIHRRSHGGRHGGHKREGLPILDGTGREIFAKPLRISGGGELGSI